MKWWEFVALLLTIVSSAVVVTWCIAGELSDTELSMVKEISSLETQITKVKSVHDLDMAAIRNRLTSNGWSRPEMQGWIDALRPIAGHPIPSLE